jgi:hypothetical protein
MPHAETGSDPLDEITTNPDLKAALRLLMVLKPGDYALEQQAE